MPLNQRAKAIDAFQKGAPDCLFLVVCQQARLLTHALMMSHADPPTTVFLLSGACITHSLLVPAHTHLTPPLTAHARLQCAPARLAST
jgi:hypothetical protein